MTDRTGVVDRSEWRWAAGAALALAVASTLPYLVAWATTPSGARFTGLLFNPQDANSYIAKMRQGFDGSWRFWLPYTPEPQEGAPVYLFYLFLGHAARWMGLPLIAVYHAARLAGGVAMTAALYALAAHLSGDVGERRAMCLLAALGAGVGWLLTPLGRMTPDLWVPEAFPVYALLANAHFPLAIGLMAAMGVCGLRIAARAGGESNGKGGLSARTWPWGVGLVLLAAALGTVQPFGLLPAFGGLGVMLAARMARRRRAPWRALAWSALAAALALAYPLYMQAAIAADPALAAWSAQNETPSPALWDWALGYGVVLALAAAGIAHGLLRRADDAPCGPFSRDAFWLLVGWAAVTMVGMYLPLPLQRRLSLGLGAPLGLLAGMGWWRAARRRIRPRLRGRIQALVVAVCALTPVFLTLTTLLAAAAGEPLFYLSGDEWAALTWLRDKGRPDAVVLCAPETGLFVPAWAGQPVVYGHPFETVDAARREEQVAAYWTGAMSPEEREAFLEENRVGYVLVGPRERALGGGPPMSGAAAFQAGEVTVYEVGR